MICEGCASNLWSTAKREKLIVRGKFPGDLMNIEAKIFNLFKS